uniref:alpha-1,2-Mannosidase n=1 Tax=Heterorhabditis bacteriophora TaxID=37862 RepID=A0A1I7X9B8_HETBA
MCTAYFVTMIFFWYSFSSCGTHFSSFFDFAIWCKCRATVKSLTFSSSVTSRMVLHRSASTMALNWLSSIVKGHPHLQSSRLCYEIFEANVELSSILAEYGSLHLEFVYLSHVLKSPLFKKKVTKIRDVLDKAEKIQGLYPNFINADTGKWTLAYHMSLGALGDSFYEYLIKSWIQSGKKDEQARKMYWDASEAIRKHMVFKSKSGLTYIAELHSGTPDHKMGHLACFCVGMFSLQAVYEKTEEKKVGILIYCLLYLPPYFNFNFLNFSGFLPFQYFSRHGENGYILRPEVIEGFFYLWRLTGKSIYQEWVWDALTAIEKHCKVEGGYAGLHNVYDPTKGFDDVQQSFFLAETLKYGYLTFTDASIISLDEWVFNTEAHPLPIIN